MNGGAVSAARDAILSAVRQAVAGGGTPEPVRREYRRQGTRSRAERVARFCERAGDYRATVRRVARTELAAVINELAPGRIGIPPGLDEGCFAVLLKVHHAAIDGIAGLELWNTLHTLTPDADVADVADDWRPEQPPAPGTLLLQAATNAVTKPLSSLWLLARNASPLVRQAMGAARSGSGCGAYPPLASGVAPRTRAGTTRRS